MVTITRAADQPDQPAMKIKNAVYLTADKSRAVPAGHEEASFLLVGPNGSVTAEQAKRYKLTEDGAEGQGKVESNVIEPFKHGVTKSTPDGVNMSPDSPQAQGLAVKLEVDEDEDDDEPVKPVAKPSATGLAPAKKRG